MQKLLKAVQVFMYIDGRACVQLGMVVSEWSPVNVALRQLCDVSVVG